jgi:cellulose biosynthesis protein BcsQ
MRVVALSSIKGGVGKTTATVNFAHLAAARGERVLLWDLDPQGAATYTLGVGARVAGGARRLAGKSKRLSRSVVNTAHDRLDMVPADFSLRYLDLELSRLEKPQRRIARMLRHVSDRYDYVFLDCPPGITLTVEGAIRASDAVVVPVVPAGLPMRSFEQLASYFQADKQLRRVELLAFLSMVDRRKRAHREMSERLPQERNEMMAQWIPASVHVEAMAVDRAPIVASHPRSPSAASYRDLFTALDETMTSSAARQ